jgi:uncharacterized protein YbjT (DUF2867 family)
MRIAVAGATGRIGRLAVQALEGAGHEPVRLSRTDGIDVVTGTGLDKALAGVDAVIDTLNTSARDPDETVAFFRTATANLLDAERTAGVGHHVLLSIVGIDRVPDNAHYRGKLAQEKAVADGGVPWTVVAATQFYDFPLMVASWTRDGDTVTLPPLLMRPIAPRDVADALVEAAAGAPRGRIEIAGPHTEDAVDMARRGFAAHGELVRIVPSWDGGGFGVSMAGNVLLPGPDARLFGTTFEEWLASGGPAAG